MEVREGYEFTDVGVIPKEWEIKKIEEVCKNNNGIKIGPFGSQLKKEYLTDSGYKVYGQENVFQKDLRIGNRYITKDHYLKLSSSELLEGDFIISMMGTVGKCMIVPSYFEKGIMDSHLIRLRLDEKIINGNFLLFFFHSENIYSQIKKLSVGGIMEGLSSKIIKQLKIPIPTNILEQKAISKVLGDVDALIESIDNLIIKKKDIKQATMQKLLTGKTRLPGFDGEWEEKQLSEISSMHGRIGWQGLKQDEFTDKSDDPFLITGTDFRGSKIDWKIAYHVSRERYAIAPNIQLRPGDVLMTKDGTIGKILIVDDIPYPGMATLNSHLLVFRPLNNSYYPFFLYYQMQSQRFIEHIEQNKSGSTFFGLSQEATGNYMVILPSFEEQIAIATILCDLDAEIEAIEKQQDKTILLKQGMMQELLTGKTRLITPIAIKQTSNIKKANIPFIRSVLAAEIVSRLYKETTFGHVKFEKMIFLVEHLCHIDTGSTYKRKAAGPYDSRALRSIDSQLKKQKWFEAIKADSRYSYVPLERVGEHTKYFKSYFSDVVETFNNIIDTFKTLKTEQCEIVATLYGAWNDLLNEGKYVDDNKIVHEVLNNWHDSKKRIPKERWLKVLDWMRKKGFTPKED